MISRSMEMRIDTSLDDDVTNNGAQAVVDMQVQQARRSGSSGALLFMPAA